MSKKNLARETIEKGIRLCVLDPAAGHPEEAPGRIAQALDDAGLLAPDLPEPRIDIDGWQEWGHKHGSSVTPEDGMVTVEIPDDISRDLSPAEARELATWLNAADDYSEGNQT